MTFSMTISMRNQRRNFLINSLRKKESDDNDDFDDVEEKAVKTAPKQASAPKQTASAPSKVTVKQERAERQTRPAASSKITPMRSSRKSNQGPNIGSLCDQTFFYGRYA